MSYAPNDFGKSMTKLQKKHKRRRKASGVKSGVTSSVNHDGIVIARPRRKSGDSPLLGVLFFVGVFVLFKSFLLASDGAEGYAERVQGFAEGTQVEMAIGWAMQVDPITEYIATTFANVVEK